MTIRNIMLDLETMGTSPRAAIVSIGAVTMDFDTLTFGHSEFYRSVDLCTSMKAGGEVDAETVWWWLSRYDESVHHLIHDSIPIRDALAAYSEWHKNLEEDAGGHMSVNVWGNGADFDNVILHEAYEKNDMVPPWHFTCNRCYRTVKEIFPDVKVPRREGVYHHALHDARRQAQHLLSIIDRHGLDKPKPFSLLGAKHTGMRVSLSGLLGRLARGGKLDEGTRFMLGELLKHLNQVSREYYGGNPSVVDNFLQLYALDDCRNQMEGG